MRLLTAWAFLGALSTAAAQDDPVSPSALERLLDAERLDVERFEALATAADFPVHSWSELLRSAPATDAGKRRCERILRALRIAGPRAAPALDTLLERWQSRHVANIAAMAGTFAVLAPYAADPAAIVRGLSDALHPQRNPFVEGDFAVTLEIGRAVTRARLGVPSFDGALQLLKGDDVLAQEFGAESLAAHGLAAAAHLRDATRIVNGARIRIRGENFRVSFQRPELSELVATAAARALAQVDPDAIEAMPWLAAMLQADLPSARRRAAMALGRHGAAAAAWVLSLLTATHDPDDPALVAEAVTALGMIGGWHPAVLERLDALAAAPDRAIAARARAARRALEPR